MGKHTEVLSHGLVVYITLVLVAGKFTFAPHPTPSKVPKYGLFKGAASPMPPWSPKDMGLKVAR